MHSVTLVVLEFDPTHRWKEDPLALHDTTLVSLLSLFNQIEKCLDLMMMMSSSSNPILKAGTRSCCDCQICLW